MKKKIVIAFCGICFVFGLSATDQSYLSEEIYTFGVSVPISFESYSDGGRKTNTTVTSIGFDFATRGIERGDSIGAYLDTSLFLPMKLEIKEPDKARYVGYYKDSSLHFGIDFQFGGYGYLLNGPILKIPLGVGLHVNALCSRSNILDYTYVSLGIGSWINLELKIGSFAAFFAGIKTSYDFWNCATKTMYEKDPIGGSYNETDSYTTGKHVNSFTVIPRIGIIIHCELKKESKNSNSDCSNVDADLK